MNGAHMTNQASDENTGILLVTRNFPPLLGGMERLNHRMLLGLAGGEPLYLVGPKGCGAWVPPGTTVRDVSASSLWRFLIGAAIAALRLGRKRPRVVIAGSGVTAPIAWLTAKVSGSRSVVYLHGLDLVVASRVYEAFWLPYIRRCDIAIANSRNTARLATGKGVMEDRLHVIHPGTDLPTPDTEARRTFRYTQKLGNRPVLLSVGRLTPRKGLVEFVREVMPRLLTAQPDLVLLIIGADAKDALSAQPGSMKQRIIAAADEGGILHALRFLKSCDDAMLHAAYRAADLHVFPVREIPGDVEGFGMVAVEAAAHGLPTVAFRVGGVGDAVLEGITGTLVATKDYGAFGGAVLEWLLRSRQAEVRLQCASAAKDFAWSKFRRRLCELLEMRQMEQ